MKTKYLAIILTLVLVFFIGCDEDSITDALLGTNSVTLSGDINKSFDAKSVAGMIYEDSTSGFVVLMQPEDSGPNSSDDILTLLQESDALPAVGNYSISIDGNSSGDFGALYIANDSTLYTMHSGSVKITESSTSKVAGTFDLTGYYGFMMDPTREIKITGQFSSIPLDLD